MLYDSRTSPWPLNQHVWILVSRHGMCFSVMHVHSFVPRLMRGGARTSLGMRLACAMKCKSLRRKAKRMYRVRECECVFGPHRTWGYSRLSRWPHALLASLGTAALSHTHRSQHGHHGVVATFTLCLLIHFRARFLALPLFHHNFCHFDVETMRLLAPLQHWER